MKSEEFKNSVNKNLSSLLRSTMLPLFLLGFFLLVMIFTVFIEASDYGLTIDEPQQDNYGRSSLSWYKTLGRDTSFLSFTPNNIYQATHGSFFEVIVAIAQRIFGHHWYTRAVVNGLAGILGIIAVALCGYELGDYWFAFVSGIFLWLYPRFYGSIFNNSKDIPLASAMTFILWAVLLLVNQWEVKHKYLRNSILVGLLIGMAASIRVVALIWYPMLLLLLIAWWIRNYKRVLQDKLLFSAMKKQGIAGGIIICVSFITMIALWPYVFLDPFKHLYESIIVMQKYPWNGTVLFNGKTYLATNLPRTYVPVWLVIGSPLIAVALTCVGLLVAVGKSLKEKVVNPGIAIVCMALIVPIIVMAGLHSTLYDAQRQFFFLIPVMMLVAAYGAITLFYFLKVRKKKVMLGILVSVIIVSYTFVIKNMYDLHPYEYSYFNSLVGGVAGAEGKYDTDYWGVCSKPTAEWLGGHYKQFTHKQKPTVTYQLAPPQAMAFLPSSFVEDDSNPDFYMASTRDHFDTHFPNYRIIHAESIEGVPMCVVKIKPGIF